MGIPKLLTVDQVAQALDLTPATLERYRANGTGPNYLKVGDGGNIRYLESDVIAYLESCRQLPTESQKMQAALLEGSAQRRAANAQRNADMVALDKADREGNGVVAPVDPYAVTVSNVGQTPGAKMERHWNVPAQSFDNRPVTVAVAPAQNGQVPVPWQK